MSKMIFKKNQKLMEQPETFVIVLGYGVEFVFHVHFIQIRQLWDSLGKFR